MASRYRLRSTFIAVLIAEVVIFFSSRRGHTRWPRDWSSDVCSSDLIQSGQQIRLAGQGGPGLGGGPPGDLFLDVEVQPDAIYRTEGRDIFVDVPIAPWEAALGAKLQAPTLGGHVDVTIPAGSQSGRKLRLKERGLPGNPPGDQYVVLRIVNPPADSPAARQLFETMRAKLDFDPRAGYSKH